MILSTSVPEPALNVKPEMPENATAAPPLSEKEPESKPVAMTTKESSPAVPSTVMIDEAKTRLASRFSNRNR
jgi:hypothetical protein